MNGIRFLAALALICTNSLLAVEPSSDAAPGGAKAPVDAGGSPAQSGIFTADLTVPFRQGSDSPAPDQSGILQAPHYPLFTGQSGIFTPDLAVPFQQGDYSLGVLGVPQDGSFVSFDARLPVMQTTPAAAMRGALQAGGFATTMGATAGFAVLGGNLIGGPYLLFQIADESEAAFEQVAGMLGLTLPTIHTPRTAALPAAFSPVRRGGEVGTHYNPNRNGL
jgi:hypothetical protein